MANMKKITTLMVALLLLSGILIGCGKKGGDGKSTTGKTEQSGKDTATAQPDDPREPLRDLPDTDAYAGYEFRILMRDNINHQTDLFAEETDGDAVSNAVFLRNQSLEETYGIVLRLVKSSSNNDDSDGIAEILAGSDDYDLLARHGRRCVTYAVNDCCLDWYDLPYLNLTYDWWAQGARDSFTFRDTLLFMTGDLSHLSTAASYVMVFNKDILRQHEIEYPYEEVKDGTWTFERMSEIAKECAEDKDGDSAYKLDSEGDILGYVTYPWGGTYCALFASGTHILTRDENDMPTVTIATETAYDALTKFFTLATDNISYLDTGDYNPQIVPTVVANRVVFHDTTLNGVAIDFRKTDLNYGIVPFPKTADVEGYASHVAGAFNVFVIPRTVTDTARTALVLEYLAQEGNRLVIPEYYESIVVGKSFRDAESFEMLPIISAGRLYDFGYFDIELKGISNLLEQLAKKNRSASEFYSFYNSNIGKAQEHLLALIELYSKY